MPRFDRFSMIASAAAAVFSLSATPLFAQRAVGIDVSAWQGTINWNTVAKPVAQGGGGKQFAFIRSSRGGTTGFYNQSDPSNAEGLNTLSQRYDDPFFVSNINGATANGMLAGPYHFGRGDIIASTVNANGIPNNGADEADHMIQQAGAWMKPGYLLPVFDLEAGQAERTSSQLSQFAVDFSDRIFAVKGIRPLIYTGQNYANYINSTVPAAFPNLWIARWPNQSNPESIDIQNSNPPPSPSTANVYGKWNASFPTIPDPQPWAFWQYASTIKVPGIGGGTANVDGDVAHGDIEWLKDFLVPALWMNDVDGVWSDAAKWNSNPGLPTINDRTIINRPSADIAVTLAGGAQNVKSLQSHERLLVTGGTLNAAQYIRLLNNASISGGTVGAASLENTLSLHISGGAVNVPSIVGTGSLNLTGGTLTAARIGQNNLITQGTALVKLVAAGTTTVSVLTNLTHAGGQIDLGNEAIVVNYSGGSPANIIRTDLLAGYAAGDWNGSGIVSSIAAGDATRALAVGFAEATDIGSLAAFLGQSIDSTSVLIRLTLYGDANLDGSVTLADFTTLAANFGTSGRWSKGDFNYDTVISLADFTALAARFGQTLPADLPRGAAIPEPTGLLALAAAVVAVWRRR